VEYAVSETHSPVVYFFDAVLRAEHYQEMVITRHPVQVSSDNSAPGGSISDHAYLMPARVTLEVGMSDVLDRYNPSDYSSDPSKSVSAYGTFLAIQARRNPLVLITRLNMYSNMLIQTLRPVEDYKTRFGLRLTIVLEQILMGQLAVAPVSAEPQITDQTEKANVPTETVPAAIQARNKVPPQAVPGINLTQTTTTYIYPPGSGGWSSEPVPPAEEPIPILGP